MPRKNPQETASMIQNRDGTPCAAPLATGQGQWKMRQLQREGDRGDINLNWTQPLTKNLRAPADEENAGDRMGKDSDGASSTDGETETKKKARCLKKPAQGRARAIAKDGEDPTLANLSFLERLSASHGTEAKHKKQIEQFLSLAVKEELARRGRRGRRGNRAVPKHELQPRTTCDQRRDPTGETSALPTPVREAGRKARSVIDTSEGLEKSGSDTFKTTVANNDLVSDLLG